MLLELQTWVMHILVSYVNIDHGYLYEHFRVRGWKSFLTSLGHGIGILRACICLGKHLPNHRSVAFRCHAIAPPNFQLARLHAPTMRTNHANST